jgi:thiamine kinase-like enzyme
MTHSVPAMGEGIDPDVEAAIEAVPDWNGLPATITPITAGITNRNFRVDVGDGSFVLRIAGRETELLGIDREAEFEAGRTAASVGVGPEVIAWLPEHSCLITRFVDGANIPEEDLQREDVLSSVVRSIRAFHASPPIRSRFPVFRIVERYQELASSRGVVVPPAFAEAHAVAERIERAFERAPMPLTTCHNDLLNANFLLEDDHTWIVDYEYAGMGDPFFDLGNLSINNGLSAEAQESLLRLYFLEVGDVHRARLALMRIMSDFREAMWGVVQQALSTLDFDYVDYADRHFARCLASGSDTLVGAWLEAGGAPV